MMRRASEVINMPIAAVDGTIGRLSDLYFDERSWRIRYLVIELSAGAAAKEVLVSPLASSPSGDGNLEVKLTKDEICRCPDRSSSTPVSMQQRESSELLFHISQSLDSYNRHFGPVIFPPVSSMNEREDGKNQNDRFCSVRTFLTCNAATADGIKYRLEDMVFDDRFWDIKFLLVSPDASLKQEIRLLVAFWVDHIEWIKKTVFLECRNDYMTHCPAFDPKVHVNVSYEDFLDHYQSLSGREAIGE
ncbi:MAG: PRC-barrel domain-containing protein [Chitinispirillaceae bacterium]|nr:PRC-barrel domain-containing protein [Chitinispirillaceae bacterium]